MEFLYYGFALGAIFTSFLVISMNNPVHSVFYLVLTFGNTSALLLLLGVEFIAIIFWIVYVGAIAILFIFVIKLLNIKIVELLDNTTRYIPLGIIIGFVLLFEISIFLNSYIVPAPITSSYSVVMNPKTYTNIEILGNILYTDYYLNIIIASLILLVAMLGAIILTLGHEESIKRQDIFTQNMKASSVFKVS